MEVRLDYKYRPQNDDSRLDLEDAVAAQRAEETRHIHQQTQPKICPSCGQPLCIGEREERRCWCCEVSWDETGKLRAGA